MNDNFKYYLFCIYVFVKGYVFICYPYVIGKPSQVFMPYSHR